ncbi:hypothetical protein C8J56DRAFT_883760 [Mycena floridula]|nr:hypothetical protein C8J56DRAFT_883760 [Mycena floridula]
MLASRVWAQKILAQCLRLLLLKRLWMMILPLWFNDFVMVKITSLIVAYQAITNPKLRDLDMDLDQIRRDAASPNKEARRASWGCAQELALGGGLKSARSLGGGAKENI